MCLKLDQKLVRSVWHYCTALDNNPWGIPPVTYEPITGGDKFEVFGIPECSSADWNAESGMNTLNMSQHCHVMNANSKH